MACHKTDSLANHVCVERMWGGSYIQILAFHFDAQASIGICEVADCDDVSLTVVEDNNGCLAVVATGIRNHLRARCNKLAEVLVGVVLGGVTFLACLAVNLNEGVLCPSPCRLAVVGENEVPIVVFIATVAKVI